MQDEFHFENIPKETFADGVKAFKLNKPIESMEEGSVFNFQNEEQLYEGDRVRVKDHGEGVVNKVIQLKLQFEFLQLQSHG